MTTNTIKCSNSNKGANFFPNGGDMNDIIVVATQDGEYWYTIGHYKGAKSAKTYAAKSLAKMGYHFDENELKNLVIE